MLGISRPPKDTLEGAEGDDTLDRTGQADGDGGEGEAGDTHQVVGAAAEAVAELAAQDESGGEGEQVGVGHPLELGGGRAQVAADLGVGDGDD
ncbi:hypothetical protein RKD33_001401 [Streptomyces sp. SAI-129]